MNFWTAYFLTRAMTADHGPGSFARKSPIAKMFVILGGMGWGFGMLMMIASQTNVGVTDGQFLFVGAIIVLAIGCIIP